MDTYQLRQKLRKKMQEAVADGFAYPATVEGVLSAHEYIRIGNHLIRYAGTAYLQEDDQVMLIPQRTGPPVIGPFLSNGAKTKNYPRVRFDNAVSLDGAMTLEGNSNEFKLDLTDEKMEYRITNPGIVTYNITEVCADTGKVMISSDDTTLNHLASKLGSGETTNRILDFTTTGDGGNEGLDISIRSIPPNLFVNSNFYEGKDYWDEIDFGGSTAMSVDKNISHADLGTLGGRYLKIEVNQNDGNKPSISQNIYDRVNAVALEDDSAYLTLGMLVYIGEYHADNKLFVYDGNFRYTWTTIGDSAGYQWVTYSINPSIFTPTELSFGLQLHSSASPYTVHIGSPIVTYGWGLPTTYQCHSLSKDAGRVWSGVEISTPSTPPTGHRHLYAKSDGWYEKDDGGTETKFGAGSGEADTLIITDTAGENLVQGNIVYLKTSDQKWWKVDADDTTPKVSSERGVATETISADSTGDIQIAGLSDDFSGLTPGSDVWASTTAGGYTQTKPSPSDGGGQVAVVRVGMAVSSTEVLLDTKTPIRYLERESLSNGSSLTIAHHTDSLGYTRTPKAYMATDIAGATLAEYADTNQDEDVGLKQQTVTYGSDICTGGTASASSYYGARFPSYAFDDDTGTLWANNNIMPAWLKYDLGEGNSGTVIKYRIHYNDNVSGWTSYIYSPDDWTFQGSNNDSDWDTLDTQTGQAWDADEWKEYTFSNSTAYRYYRIYITAAHTGNYVAIHEMEMLEAGTPDDGPTELAQGFQVSGAQTVETVKLWLKKVGSPTGNLTVEIQTDSGGDPSGTPVSNGTSNTVAASSLSTSYGWISFTFATNPSISGSTQYHLVLGTTDSQSTTNYTVWGADGSSPSYSNGEMKEYDSGWSSLSMDACFGVFGPGTTYESPILVDRWGGSLAVMLCRYDDGSDNNPETNTTFKNNTGSTADVTCVVELP